jgi:SAM-dependent methyltransferase
MTDVPFNEAVARTYDRDSASRFAPEVLDPTVEFLAALAGDGATLEFGVGTGRVALPLAARGIPVHGIDISAPMLEQLGRKPGAESIGTTLGSFATTRVDGSFRLVYLVFNTIMNLTSQEEQIACFQNAADHLGPGGCFVIEVLVPRLWALSPGERVQPFHLSEHRVGFDEYTDFTRQTLVSHHIRDDDGAFRHFSAPFRWVWPSELDLMARLAGMTLRDRFANFHRAPFTDESPSHLSVWEKTG